MTMYVEVQQRSLENSDEEPVDDYLLDNVLALRA